ncbi:MAG: hypothetical protein AAGC73_04980 [Verrucomicrobiota bacterium]
MPPEDDAPLTLSKWPFYVGDVLLVAIALAIAILGDWQLSDWQVASCVTAVALGAVLFVMPYVVEFYMRGEERSDDRSSELHHLGRRLGRLEAGIESFQDQLETLAETPLEPSQQADALAEAFDQKLKRLDALSEALDHFKRRQTQELKAIHKAINAQPEPTDLSSFEARFVALEKGLKDLAAEKVERPAPKRQPRKRRKSEVPLIQRAIEVEQEQSSVAVKRIIQSVPKPAEPAEPASERLVADPAESDALAVDAAQVDAVEADVAEPVVMIEPEIPGEVTEVPKKSETGLESAASLAVPMPDDGFDLNAAVPQIDATDMLFDDVPAKPRANRGRAKKADTILTVKALIGIGNRPYLRGSGGGLSWEQGIEMDFQEIGKWRWVAAEPIEGPITFEIYRNDEDPDQSGRHQIGPGQKLELSPRFA